MGSSSLPFTRDQFLDVFADYNDALWPAAIVLWVLTAAAFMSLGRGAADDRRSIGFLLALHWLWAAVAYHASFFTAINPAAWLFAGLFLVEAGLLAWHGGVRADLRFVTGSSLRHVSSRVLVAYALIYPALVWAGGLRYPWMPTFGVPCPTTLLTIGFLLAAEPPVPRVVMAIPIVWAGIAGSAAMVLGVHADLMLIVAGVVLTIDAAGATFIGSRITDEELNRAMLGDAEVSNPNYRAALAVTIDAPPKCVWPWLLQMGRGRGGLYSYDWLDRLFGYLDRPSADRVLPEFQHLAVGDVIPVGGAAGGFPVRAVKPYEALVLGGETDGFQWVWQLSLVSIGSNQTRLISRNQARVPRSITSFLFMLALKPAAFIMTRKMLLGIKRRAEALCRESGNSRVPLLPSVRV